MNKFWPKALILISMVTIVACSSVDIEDESSVLKDIQGTWIGQEWTGNFYRHIKVTIKENNRFEGWLQATDSIQEPVWTVLPGEIGSFSISSALKENAGPGKYRSFNFAMQGRCCTDNSLTAKTLSELITYHDKKGLCIRDSVPMTQVQ